MGPLPPARRGRGLGRPRGGRRGVPGFQGVPEGRPPAGRPTPLPAPSKSAPTRGGLDRLSPARSPRPWAACRRERPQWRVQLRGRAGSAGLASAAESARLPPPPVTPPTALPGDAGAAESVGSPRPCQRRGTKADGENVSGPRKEGKHRMGGNVSHITDATFESTVINSAKPAMVDFWATWCGPCKIIPPHVEALAGAFAA